MLLPDGKVFVAGGEDNGRALASAELYDSEVANWTNTGSLAIARHRHTATLLTNAKVLIAGGSGPGNTSLANAELYDPATGIWATIASLTHGHSDHTRPNGKVLVAGGYEGDFPRTYVELYDPVNGT